MESVCWIRSQFSITYQPGIYRLIQYVGCGKIPTANEDIVQSIKVGSFEFNDPLDHLKVRLKGELQEGKDYEFIGKEMFFWLQQCQEYNMIKVPRKVVKTKEGKKV